MSKVTKYAEGRECTIRLPGCLWDHGVVGAHYRLMGTCGTGYKPNDLQLAWACSHCHAIVDGPRTDEIRLAHAEGMMRTIEILLKEGKIKI